MPAAQSAERSPIGGEKQSRSSTLGLRAIVTTGPAARPTEWSLKAVLVRPSPATYLPTYHHHYPLPTPIHFPCPSGQRARHRGVESQLPYFRGDGAARPHLFPQLRVRMALARHCPTA